MSRHASVEAEAGITDQNRAGKTSSAVSPSAAIAAGTASPRASAAASCAQAGELSIPYADDLTVAQAVERIEGVLDFEVRRVGHSWAGLRTLAPDREPVIGYDATVTSPAGKVPRPQGRSEDMTRQA
jgi:hypothetical protein